MNKMRRRKNITNRRRGTATIEFICSVPLLAVIIALTFFFGHVRVNQQHVQVAARYSAWVGWHSDIEEFQIDWDLMSDPGGENRQMGSYLPENPEILNSIFMDNRSTETNLDMVWIYLGTPDDYIDLVSRDSQAAGELAENLIDNYFDRSRQATVDAVFPSPVNLWELYEGDLHARSSREGLEWARGSAFCEYAVTEQFLTTIDSALLSVPSPGNRLALTVRRLYLWPW